ncbi:MAG: hypothetical protein RBT61_10045 [Candidatus Kapabacteria bacterium]|jgi:hypothetical protein|nr:hypothetical protein [Candidatus Kapabacteria bacterium]
MQKLILLLVMLISSACYSLPCEFLGIDAYCIENNNLSNQNQIVVSWYKTGWDNFGNENLQMYNFSIGLRTHSFSKPLPIGKLVFYQKSSIIPTDKYDNYQDSERPLVPCGGRDYTLWNRLGNGTILNIDMTDFEELYIKWAQIQYGFGLDTRNLIKTDKLFYHAFLSGKLGLSSITYGDNNFKSKKDNLTHDISLETGIKLNTGITYKRDFIFEPFIDYTFYIAENIVHKISCGISTEYYDYILISKSGSYSNFIKFSFGVNYNKYFFEKTEQEFLKFDFGIKYFVF